jgi:hypothetical protein
MKRILTTMAICATVALLVGTTAEAGLFGKDKKKDAQQHKTWRYDRYPKMSFHAGVLRQDGRTGWKLGDTDLVLDEKCIVFGAGGGQLQGGRTAVVMGVRTAGTIVAWTVQIQKSSTSLPSLDDDDTQIEWSISDPTVGVGRAPS